MSDRAQRQMDEMMNAVRMNQWIEQFNEICKSSYIDLNDDESVQRVFLVPEDAVRLDDVMVRPDYTKHAYALSHKTDEDFTAAQRAQEILAGMQNGCSIYVSAPCSYGYRKLTLDKDLKPILSEEVHAPANEAPKAPTKPSGWKRFANWLTRGSAYKEDFQKYDTDMQNYHNALADHMEKVEEFAKVQAINGRSVGRNYTVEGEYQKRVDFERQKIILNQKTQKNRKDVSVIRNSFNYLFSPDMNASEASFADHGTDPLQLDAIRNAKFQVPKGMTMMQATALAFAASISEQALTGIGNSTSTSLVTDQISNHRTMMVENYLPRPQERQNRQKYLDNAIINGRKMMPELLDAIANGNLEPAANTLRSAITGLVDNRRFSDSIEGNSIISYGTALEGLRDCLSIPGMEAAVGLSERDKKQMDALIGLGRLARSTPDYVSNLLTTDYMPEEKEMRDEELQRVIAAKLMQADFYKEKSALEKELVQPTEDARERQQQAIKEAIANEKKALTEKAHAGTISVDEANERLKQFSVETRATLEQFDVLLVDEKDALVKQRPLTSLEEKVRHDPDAVMAEYIDKAKRTALYQEISKETDPFTFREKADMLVSNLYQKQLSREPISENELSGRQPQQVSMNRAVQPTRTMDMANSKK